MLIPQDCNENCNGKNSIVNSKELKQRYRKQRYWLKAALSVGLILLFFVSAVYATAPQDGFGNSMRKVNGTPLGDNINMRGYPAFPPGVSGANKFSGAVYDGQHIWLIPTGAQSVVRVNPATGGMTGYNNWPAGFKIDGQYKFRSGAYDGAEGIWLIPFSAEAVIRLDIKSGVMTAFDDWPDTVLYASSSQAVEKTAGLMSASPCSSCLNIW